MATNQGFKSFIPNPRRLVPGYLYHWLRCNRSYIEGLGNGATFKEVSKAVVSRIEIPTPPVPEQRRIATILDHADALRVKRRVALAQLDEMAQAIFLEMFGDLHTNPRRWPVVPVSRYVEAFQGGKSLEADGEESGGRYRVLKISAVTGMFFKASESKPLSDIYVPPQTHFVRSGDLLFSRANTTELVGAIAYVDYAPANLLLPDKLWRFVWRSPTSVEPLFIWELFQTPAIREEIGRRATGTSGSMKNISQEKLLAMNTILPPLPLQKEFVKRLSAVRRVNENFLDSAKQLDTLFASLQHRAFNGEL